MGKRFVHTVFVLLSAVALLGITARPHLHSVCEECAAAHSLCGGSSECAHDCEGHETGECADNCPVDHFFRTLSGKESDCKFGCCGDDYPGHALFFTADFSEGIHLQHLRYGQEFLFRPIAHPETEPALFSCLSLRAPPAVFSL